MKNPIDHQWHGDKQQGMKSKPVASLQYILKDSHEAALAMESIGDAQKAGQYWDEHFYAAAELKARRAT